MRVLGIDPGFERVGVALLSGSRDKPSLEYSTCLRTSASFSFPERLASIGKELEAVIKKYAPKVLAIETLFFSANKKTALRVAEARGVVLYCAAKNNLKTFEYSPADIKIALTGYGKAEKAQVTTMVQKILGVCKETTDDEYDAIAVALTHLVSKNENGQ